MTARRIILFSWYVAVCAAVLLLAGCHASGLDLLPAGNDEPVVMVDTPDPVVSAEAAAPADEPEPAVQEAVPEVLPVAPPSLRELVESLVAADVPASVAVTEAAAAFDEGDRDSRKYETALSDFITDTEARYLRKNGIDVDFAFLTAELIRTGIPEGSVTVGAINHALPYTTYVAVIELSGAELTQLFTLIEAIPQGSRSFPHFSSEVRYEIAFDTTGFNGSMQNVTVSGEPIDPERTYVVAFNDYLSAGGSGFAFFAESGIQPIVSAVTLNQAIAEYSLLQYDSICPETDGRLTITGGITE